MTLPPVIERELRVAARRASTFWIRCLLASVAVFKGAEMLNNFSFDPAVAGVTGAELLREFAWIAYLATLSMGVLTADSISHERRDGTLGLLLLTDLKPWQIVFGKLCSRGLIAFTGLAGFLPMLVISVFAGGTSGFEVFCTGVGLLADLFVVLAAGLWMSAIFKERTNAVAATLVVVGALGFGAEIFGAGLLGPGDAPLSRLLTLSGWRTISQLPFLLSPLLVLWLAVMVGLGWLFMYAAARSLGKNWRDEPNEQFRKPEPSDVWGGVPPVIADIPEPPETPEAALARASWLTDPRPWDADPMRWRATRIGSVQGTIWFAMGLNCAGQFGLLAASFDSGIAGVVSVGLLAVTLFAGALLARVAARFFQQSRQEGDLELLMTTPIGGRDILLGQWKELRRALRVPVGLVLGFGLFIGVSLAVGRANYSREEFWSLVVACLMAISLAVETRTMCWVGMRCGFRAPNTLSAVCWTLAVVQVAPFVLVTLFAALLLVSHVSPFGGMPFAVIALLLWVVKNIALVIWAKARLRQDLRLQS